MVTLGELHDANHRLMGKWKKEMAQLPKGAPPPSKPTKLTLQDLEAKSSLHPITSIDVDGQRIDMKEVKKKVSLKASRLGLWLSPTRQAGHQFLFP
ncbi:hypothetical protein QFC21_000655 [Naganishia friedmannii]|uniref:Uncharacterized protein n=1 Tax=Naganishia friedmannii TaxID=89922 RepID=A0ACC2WD31_9TREE|nr:hypothetical protein QFC21_000655 [Naganishia friedmannii]